jgi:hypothetical protein
MSLEALASMWYGFTRARDYIIMQNGTVIAVAAEEDDPVEYMKRVCIYLDNIDIGQCTHVIVTDLFSFTYFGDPAVVVLDVEPDIEAAVENLLSDIDEMSPYMIKIKNSIYLCE